MGFADYKSGKTPSLSEIPPFVHGFNSSFSTDTLNQWGEPSTAFQAVKSQTIEVCPREKEKLRYKQNLACDVVAALLRSSENPLMTAQAVRIEKCNSDGNLFVAADLHTADGELFDGKGSLWACNSRLCPNCTGKLSKRSRKIIRYVMENQKLFVGEGWYFPTLTMPNLNLQSLPLPLIAEIMQTAWKRFSALETRENKKQTWFQETIRGGFKNAEFTVTRTDAYNYHLHGLIISKSSIQRDGFLKIREHWTKALQFAFKKFGVEWECRTGNKNFIPALLSFLWSKPLMSLFLNARHQTKFFGLANVNVVKVDWTNREKTINELAKYVTKSDSWSRIPLEQLETIVSVPRFWRMFESFGVCRVTAREMKEKPLVPAENSIDETVNQSANLNDGAYLDTKELINRHISERRKSRRVPWRIRAREIPIWQYKIELADEIEAVQSFRRKQLRMKFEFATFQTLDGRSFSYG